MTRVASRVLRLAALAGIVAGCEGSNGVTGIEKDPDDIFWSLALNQRAINLALDQTQPQFYTYQLVATPLRRDGTPIADAGTPTFVSADTNRVHVSATGLITARGVTSTPVRVVASMSGRPGPVTNADTAWVTVTSTVRPVANFTMRPARTSFGIGYDTMLVAKATNAAGAAVTGLRVAYSSSLPKVASYDATGLFMPLTLGQARLRASMAAYGVEFRDSVDVTVTAPVIFHVNIDFFTNSAGVFDTKFDPVELTIKAGQGVSWGSKNAISADIRFDDPTNVGPSPVDGARGNIPPFAGLGIRRIRMFHVPGTYEYRDAATGKTAVGRIIVTP